MGPVKAGHAPRRIGAKPGQKIYVTGTIGDAALGLKLRRDAGLKNTWGLTDGDVRHLDGRYLLPEPRIDAAGLVAEFASASMDVSDGLAGDLARMCAASEAGAEIDAARVPFSEAARKAVKADPEALAAALTGGDDYEILLTVEAGRTADFEAAAARAGIAVSAIGDVLAPFAGTVRVMAAGTPLTLKSLAFRHF